jgi:hypothetical protein
MTLWQPAINYHHPHLIHSSLSLSWRGTARAEGTQGNVGMIPCSLCREGCRDFVGCRGFNWIGLPIELLSFSKWICCSTRTTAAADSPEFPEGKPGPLLVWVQPLRLILKAMQRVPLHGLLLAPICMPKSCSGGLGSRRSLVSEAGVTSGHFLGKREP